MLAIHDSSAGFHPRWIAYCERQNIPYKRVDCYASDIVDQVKGCDLLMWHYGQSNPKDMLIARPILSALEHAGFPIFPDFRTAWHFDDKVAQKYLFEALEIPAVPAEVFVEREKALAWVAQAEFPKVFKLRRGAGSHGVRLAHNRREARRLVRRAFGRGFPLYDPMRILRETIYKYRIKKISFMKIGNALVRFLIPPRFSRIIGRERGYVYFQEFLPNNECDIRVIVIGNRAFGIRRMVRPGDFRASGSGKITYARKDIDERCVALSFRVGRRLGSQCVALDFIFDEDCNPRIVEVSFGFSIEGYEPCEGYWDNQLIWYEGDFDPYGWMIDLTIMKASQVKLGNHQKTMCKRT